MRRDRRDVQLLYRMDRDHFATIRRDDIVLSGADSVRPMLGLDG